MTYRTVLAGAALLVAIISPASALPDAKLSTVAIPASMHVSDDVQMAGCGSAIAWRSLTGAAGFQPDSETWFRIDGVPPAIAGSSSACVTAAYSPEAPYIQVQLVSEGRTAPLPPCPFEVLVGQGPSVGSMAYDHAFGALVGISYPERVMVAGLKQCSFINIAVRHLESASISGWSRVSVPATAQIALAPFPVHRAEAPQKIRLVSVVSGLATSDSLILFTDALATTAPRFGVIDTVAKTESIYQFDERHHGERLYTPIEWKGDYIVAGTFGVYAIKPNDVATVLYKEYPGNHVFHSDKYERRPAVSIDDSGSLILLDANDGHLVRCSSLSPDACTALRFPAGVDAYTLRGGVLYAIDATNQKLYSARVADL